jgi:hypothetical protein
MGQSLLQHTLNADLLEKQERRIRRAKERAEKQKDN